jgi:hypothetical protein
LRVHFELYDANDTISWDFEDPALSAELQYDTHAFSYRFSYLNESLSIINEPQKRSINSHWLSIRTDRFESFISYSHHDERNIQAQTFSNDFNTSSLFSNMYINLFDPLWLRSKLFFSESNFKQPSNFSFSDNEVLYGLMLREYGVEVEMLAGTGVEKFGDLYENKSTIFDE